MKPSEFEEFISEFYTSKGYKTELTVQSGDYGVDIFATKGKEKLAIQVKMYGGTSRKVNRQCVMELYGAKTYFDCTKGILATNGLLLTDATEVALKLGIEVKYFGTKNITLKRENNHNNGLSFEEIWTKYIILLKGKSLVRSNGESNTIVNVDWSGIERITSRGNKSFIKIEIFKLAINQLLSNGNITRDEINQNYTGRASSGVILILSQVPLFTCTSRPMGLELKV